MKFIDIKTEGGKIRGKLSFYCAALRVSRQGFYYYLKHKNDPWKYEDIAEKIRAIIAEDECNDTYGRSRMYDALKQKYPEDDIPGERTVYRIMQKIGFSTILITHDADEAILLSDRIYLLTGSPGEIHHELRIGTPREDRRDFNLQPEFVLYKRQIRDALEQASG